MDVLGTVLISIATSIATIITFEFFVLGLLKVNQRTVAPRLISWLGLNEKFGLASEVKKNTLDLESLDRCQMNLLDSITKMDITKKFEIVRNAIDTNTQSIKKLKTSKASTASVSSIKKLVDSQRSRSSSIRKTSKKPSKK